jgi:hypothetical protein
MTGALRKMNRAPGIVLQSGTLRNGKNRESKRCQLFQLTEWRVGRARQRQQSGTPGGILQVTERLVQSFTQLWNGEFQHSLCRCRRSRACLPQSCGRTGCSSGDREHTGEVEFIFHDAVRTPWDFGLIGLFHKVESSEAQRNSCIRK